MLQDKLYNLPSFRRQYEALIALSVCETIPYLEWAVSKERLLTQIDWNNLLGISSVFSYSEHTDHLDAALRIAQTCLLQECSQQQKAAAVVILENLTNKPAIRLAVERALITKTYRQLLPLPFQIQTAQTSIENTILINERILELNKFQKKVYDTHELYDSISISAPTSAGKSYILYQIILEQIVNGNKNIVYLVPTRALISQVEHDIRELLSLHNLIDVSISTVPQYNTSDAKSSNIFVFTQERLHWFLLDNASFQIDFLIVDEAQKIDDGNRGILLQQKIEDLVSMNPNLKVFFSSPFTSNPELLLENVKNDGKKEKVNTQFISVNQNLLYITQVPRKIEQWQVSLCLQQKVIPLGHITLSERPGDSDFKKLILIAKVFSGNKGGNLIYSNGSAEAEKVALILYDAISVDASEYAKLGDLIDLVKKTVHKDYSLGRVLTKGIAFHYGNMPLLIRQQIEQLFKEGHIKYLICTSTLLEGVNLPSKSIFIRKPTRGKGNPLNENDFWNLAGRAGRWGKEFSGNIVCIEPQKWEIPPNPNKSKQRIHRAIDTIEQNSKELLDYISNDTPREVANKRQDLEFAFGYYYGRFLDNKLDSSNTFHKVLFDVFMALKERIILPNNVIQRNPGISPIAQQSLFDYFIERKNDAESLIPVYPEDENALAEYEHLVGRIGETISNYPKELNTSRAILLINWMQGRPLSYLISASFKSYQKNEKYKRVKTLPVVIRETMDNVENFVRFRFAKDSSCYVDILRYFLQEQQMINLTNKIPEINLWLEFGVSQQTQLSLLSLGLTRNTVIEVSQYITNTQLTREECLQWLIENDINQLDLSPIILEDIRNVLPRKSD